MLDSAAVEHQLPLASASLVLYDPLHAGCSTENQCFISVAHVTILIHIQHTIVQYMYM